MTRCEIINCGREAAFDEDGEHVPGDESAVLCERHAPDPSVRSWAEMRAEGIEIEAMAEYAAELRFPVGGEYEDDDRDDPDYEREW